MGYEEKKVPIAIDGTEASGDALLETEEILLRVSGEPKRRKIPLASLTKLRAEDGALSFTSEKTRYVITLGARAERWRLRIEKPPSLLDKLGIREGTRVHVSGLDEEAAFLAELGARGVASTPLAKDVAFAVIGMTTQAELSKLATLRKKLADDAALWIVWPKGKKELTEDHVRAAALGVGLVDVKVARFSEQRSALKLVVPVKDRAKK